MYNFNEIQIESNIRTKFMDIWNHKTTGNTGDIIPIYTKEILPGDYIKLNVKALAKMTTPIYQTMDQIFLDLQFYFIPRRLVWKHWKEFQGEKSVGPHETQPEYTIPQTTAPTGGWTENTIADYMGIPTKVNNLSVDSAYFRSYVLVFNEWFRDQNRQDFSDFTDGDETTPGSNGNDYVTDAIGGGKCLKAAKLHDYFTSTLLTPTGQQQVLLPLGTSAPVQGNGMTLGLTNGTNNYGAAWTTTNALTAYTTIYGQPVTGTPTGSGVGTNSKIAVTQDGSKSGLIANLSEATAATVNQLRLAFQLQKIFEANNRSGSRYIETLKNRWNVTPSDATLQRPEYLGGKRIPIHIDMVVQTSSTNQESPLGQVAGFSNTFDENEYFSKGFEEHGILLGLAIVRHQRTYQQGLSKFFTRKNMEDFYMPEFQNIGEQNVYNYEIFATGTNKDQETFGYQEYGAEYRSTPNRVSGEFRSNATNSFDVWHYADDYETTPVNNDEWIVENGKAVDRTLTIPSTTANQFYFDFAFEEENIRTMPPHSIPGFIDHH